MNRTAGQLQGQTNMQDVDAHKPNKAGRRGKKEDKQAMAIARRETFVSLDQVMEMTLPFSVLLRPIKRNGTP